MEASSLAIGTKTSSKASVKKSGMMGVSIKAFIKMLPKKDKVSIVGLMGTGI